MVAYKYDTARTVLCIAPSPVPITYKWSTIGEQARTERQIDHLKESDWNQDNEADYLVDSEKEYH